MNQVSNKPLYEQWETIGSCETCGGLGEIHYRKLVEVPYLNAGNEFKVRKR